MPHPLQRLCIFYSSSRGTNPAQLPAAQAVGRDLARRVIVLDYSGGNVGLMDALADAALATGGQVIGVIPKALLAKEVGHRELVIADADLNRLLERMAAFQPPPVHKWIDRDAA